MKLYLIRHGRQNSRLCNVNVDLCEEGYRQAALLGERLFPKKIQAVYSSDLLRAVETAQAANLYWNVDTPSVRNFVKLISGRWKVFLMKRLL